MKITKIRLKEIIREEMGSIHSRLKREDNNVMEPSPSTGLGNLWRDLNILLERWLDKEHPYYIDLHNLLEDYSTSPDRPTRLPPEPSIEEGKKKGMFDQPDFKSKVAWVKRNKPEVDDPDAYVAGALRKAGELKESKKH